MNVAATLPALDDAARAAVMVMLLDEAQAATILARLEPHELQLLGEKMCLLGEIGPDLITQAISGFVKSTERQGISAGNRPAQVRSLITSAVGEVKAESMMQRILPLGEERGPAIELVRWLTPQALTRALIASISAGLPFCFIAAWLIATATDRRLTAPGLLLATATSRPSS